MIYIWSKLVLLADAVLFAAFVAPYRFAQRRMLAVTIKTRLFLAAAIASFLVSPAYAALDLAGLSNTFKSQGGAFMNITGGILFIVGVLFVAGALFKLRGHSNDPREHKIKDVFIMMLAGICLIAIPDVLGFGVSSLFGSSANTLSVTGSGQLNSINGGGTAAP